MKTITLTQHFDGTTYALVDALGCFVAHTSAPALFRIELEDRLNGEGELFARVLADTNKFICWNAKDAKPFVGLPSTDRAAMLGFLTREHLLAFVDTFRADLVDVEISELKGYHPTTAAKRFEVVLATPTPAPPKDAP